MLRNEEPDTLDEGERKPEVLKKEMSFYFYTLSSVPDLHSSTFYGSTQRRTVVGIRWMAFSPSFSH